MKKKKRILTIFAGLFTLILVIPFTFYAFTSIVALFSNTDDLGAVIAAIFLAIPALMLAITCFAFAVAYLVCGIKLCKCGFSDDTYYNESKGSVIGVSIFEIVTFFFLLFFSFIEFDDEIIKWSIYVGVGVCAVCPIFAFIDYFIFKSQIKNNKVIIDQVKGVNLHITKTYVMNAELTKLEEMKNDKLISEEEYVKFKEAIINKSQKELESITDEQQETEK